MPRRSPLQQPVFQRRDLLQAGAIGLMGLSLGEVQVLRSSPGERGAAPPKSVIYIFLSGGLAQHDSFDPKPDAPAEIRGEFDPIHTRTPGIHICEHLPRLAARSHKWALVRSLTHPSNDHSLGHHIMLTGRSQAPVGFSPNMPRPTDFPAMVSVAGNMVQRRNNLPSAAVVPSDRNGGYPAESPQTPENMAATIYEALGIPKAAMWRDPQNRPHHVYYGEPIAGLAG